MQATVALSTTEAKYMAISEACKEAIWLRGLYTELCGVTSCTTIFYDSRSAICLTKDQMFHERTKHIDVTIFEMLLLKVMLKYARLVLMIIPLI